MHAVRPIPASITLAAGDLALTADEMDRLTEAAGLPLSRLLSDDNDLDALPDRQRALVWLALRREGFDPSWRECGQVALKRSDTPDPTGGG